MDSGPPQQIEMCGETIVPNPNICRSGPVPILHWIWKSWCILNPDIILLDAMRSQHILCLSVDWCQGSWSKEFDIPAIWSLMVDQEGMRSTAWFSDLSVSCQCFESFQSFENVGWLELKEVELCYKIPALIIHKDLFWGPGPTWHICGRGLVKWNWKTVAILTSQCFLSLP